MARRVVISGLGPVSGLGLGIDATWQRAVEGRSAIARVTAFNPDGFASQIAGEVKDFNIRDVVPKSYRKATKVMARDIELAVAAADHAARDAGLVTRGTDPEGTLSYAPSRVGAHIGAGLIAADLNELTAALHESRNDAGGFDIHKWGEVGITHLTPLWLLKYLPNMLACHVTIIHDAQGPSNTITCNETSGALSLGESLRVIQRGMADACFCGGVDSKLNPMAFLRQQLTGRLNTTDNHRPTEAVRPFSQDAAGGATAEGGGILVLEAEDTCKARGKSDAYAVIAGFGASQTVNLKTRNLTPDDDGKAIAGAIRSAMRDAGITPAEVDLILPFGCGSPVWDNAEANALRTIFGSRLKDVPVRSTKALAGTCGAGSSALDLCVGAKAMREQTIPAAINCAKPLDGIRAGTEASRGATIRNVLCVATGIGGQNAAVVLSRA
jgi:3-oxoacyl-[acyl-carrier-protein] synthase II